MPGRGTPPSFTPTGVYNGDPITLLAMAGGATTGPGPTIQVGDYHTLRVSLTGLSFAGGTSPTVTFTVETSSGDGTWNTLTPTISQGGSLAGLAAGATRRIVFTGFDRFVRVNWTTTGTPTSVSATLAGEAL
jgi:hypothetical protein